MPRAARSIAATLTTLALLAASSAAWAGDPPAGADPPAAAPSDAVPAPATPPAKPKPARPPTFPIGDAALFEAQRLPWYAPATLSYQEGQPIPPGYRLETRRRRSLIAAGASIFGASYLIAALTAGTVVGGYDKHRSEVAPLFVPFAGPFITLATSRDVQLNDADRRTNGVLLLVDGATQLTGAVLFFVGLATREPILTRTKASYRPEEEARATPEILVGGRSAALRWRF